MPETGPLGPQTREPAPAATHPLPPGPGRDRSPPPKVCGRRPGRAQGRGCPCGDPLAAAALLTSSRLASSGPTAGGPESFLMRGFLSPL